MTRSLTSSSPGRRRQLRSTAAPTSLRPATRWLGSGSLWERTLLSGAEPEWHAKRRRLLSPGGRGFPPVVHAPCAKQCLRAYPEPVVKHRALLTDGRPESVLGFPTTGYRLQLVRRPNTLTGTRQNRVPILL